MHVLHVNLPLLGFLREEIVSGTGWSSRAQQNQIGTQWHVHHEDYPLLLVTKKWDFPKKIHVMDLRNFMSFKELLVNVIHWKVSPLFKYTRKYVHPPPSPFHSCSSVVFVKKLQIDHPPGTVGLTMMAQQKSPVRCKYMNPKWTFSDMSTHLRKRCTSFRSKGTLGFVYSVVQGFGVFASSSNCVLVVSEMTQILRAGMREGNILAYKIIHAFSLGCGKCELFICALYNLKKGLEKTESNERDQRNSLCGICGHSWKTEHRIFFQHPL